MKEIKCPSCGKAFQIDPSSYEVILLQIKNDEFSRQIEERIKIVEEDKKKGIEIATSTHVVVHDADLEYFPDDLIEMFKLIKTNSESLILGSRTLKECLLIQLEDLNTSLPYKILEKSFDEKLL